MTNERVIPTPAPADLPTVTILSGGTEISAEYNIVSITVTRTINKVAAAQVTLLDGDVAAEDFEASNTDDFTPGREIEILAGYHTNESTLFKGIIVQHGVKVRKNKPSLLVIDCKDPIVKMTVGRKNAYYRDITDSEIIEELIGNYGLSAEVEATDVQHAEMVQYDTTDWDFMVTRAEANGKLVFVDDGTVEVKAPDTGQDPILSLIHGSTIIEFEAAIDARNQLAAAKCTSWDYSSQELIEEETDSISFSEQGNLAVDDLAEVIGLDALSMRHTGRISDAQLKAWADARLLKSRLAKIIGRVRCQGFGDIKPGHMLELNGVGDRFNGNAFVTAVRQQITTRNWESDIQFGRDPAWFSEMHTTAGPPAAGLLPAVRGLQIGVVTQLEEDPDGEDRVQVRMPVVDPAEEGIWARVASPDAGENRGIFFRPEIGDEVVLGFLNDDPRDPVIVGQLNSSAKPAPITASDDNHEKGIVTRSEVKMMFNDEKVSLTIETPNGNKITISDDDGSIVVADENSNTITMDSSGVAIESQGDINIKAAGDVNIEGMNTSIKASAQYKAEGSAGVEMSSSATAVVKGSLVQIN
jgi:Rhs element Vgr protein